MLGIIGLGQVGTHTRSLFEGRQSLVCYDKLSGSEYPDAGLQQCDFAIICVNTPMNPDGSASLDDVRSAVSALPAELPIVLRSTVPPGTCEALSLEFEREIIFWPEYVGETNFAISTWTALSNQHPFLIFGGNGTSIQKKWVDLAAEVFGPLVRIHQVSHAEAELIKYMENTYFAMKVAFVNEFRTVVEAFGADWQHVRQGWLLDPRISRDHSDAFASSRGFDGKCLPKDLSALVVAARLAGVHATLLECVQASNAQSTQPTAPAPD
jgi:UDPglucose 6-dehydrogenase